jgi:hypothetical protein
MRPDRHQDKVDELTRGIPGEAAVPLGPHPGGRDQGVGARGQ